MLWPLWILRRDRCAAVHGHASMRAVRNDVANELHVGCMSNYSTDFSATLVKLTAGPWKSRGWRTCGWFRSKDTSSLGNFSVWKQSTSNSNCLSGLKLRIFRFYKSRNTNCLKLCLWVRFSPSGYPKVYHTHYKLVGVFSSICRWCCCSYKFLITGQQLVLLLGLSRLSYRVYATCQLALIKLSRDHITLRNGLGYFGFYPKSMCWVRLAKSFDSEILFCWLPQFSDRLNANAPSGLAPAAKPLRVSLADYAAGGQYVWGQNP